MNCGALRVLPCFVLSLTILHRPSNFEQVEALARKNNGALHILLSSVLKSDEPAINSHVWRVTACAVITQFGAQQPCKYPCQPQ